VFGDVNVLEVPASVMLRAQKSEVPNVGVATRIKIGLVVYFASGCRFVTPFPHTGVLDTHQRQALQRCSQPPVPPENQLCPLRAFSYSRIQITPSRKSYRCHERLGCWFRSFAFFFLVWMSGDQLDGGGPTGRGPRACEWEGPAGGDRTRIQLHKMVLPVLCVTQLVQRFT
jgi:hypothetical protein